MTPTTLILATLGLWTSALLLGLLFDRWERYESERSTREWERMQGSGT